MLNYFAKNISLLIVLLDLKQRTLSEQTGISQSRISRLVNGASPDYGEVSALAKAFEVSTTMLTEEDLSARFSDKNSWEKWVEQNRRKEDAAKRHLSAVSTAPIKITALQNHYIKTMSELTGKSEKELQKEIESIFQELLQEFQQALSSRPVQDL